MNNEQGPTNEAMSKAQVMCKEQGPSNGQGIRFNARTFSVNSLPAGGFRVSGFGFRASPVRGESQRPVMARIETLNRSRRRQENQNPPKWGGMRPANARYLCRRLCRTLCRRSVRQSVRQSGGSAATKCAVGPQESVLFQEFSARMSLEPSPIGRFLPSEIVPYAF